MYEKYDASKVGKGGGGGEYEVQIGFGWTNGVILHLLQLYGDRLVAPAVPPTPPLSRAEPESKSAFEPRQPGKERRWLPVTGPFNTAAALAAYQYQQQYQQRHQLPVELEQQEKQQKQEKRVESRPEKEIQTIMKTAEPQLQRHPDSVRKLLSSAVAASLSQAKHAQLQPQQPRQSNSNSIPTTNSRQPTSDSSAVISAEQQQEASFEVELHTTDDTTASRQTASVVRLSRRLSTNKRKVF